MQLKIATISSKIIIIKCDFNIKYDTSLNIIKRTAIGYYLPIK